jgi:hypothetical protein
MAKGQEGRLRYRFPLHLSHGIVLLMACLVGCSRLFPGSLQPVEEPQEQQILQVLRQKEAAIRTLRGLFQASISGSGIPFSQNILGTVSYRQPDVVHLKGFIRFGVPVMDFHRDGNLYELSFPAEGKVVAGRMDHTGEPTPWDQTVMLSIHALDAVLGKISGLSGTDVQVWKTDERYRIDMVPNASSFSSARDDFTVRSWVDAQTLELRLIEYRRSFDDIVVSVKCDDYRNVPVPVSGEGAVLRLPFLVQAIDHRPAGGTIRMNFQEFIVNAGNDLTYAPDVNNPSRLQ